MFQQAIIVETVVASTRKKKMDTIDIEMMVEKEDVQKRRLIRKFRDM